LPLGKANQIEISWYFSIPSG